jgi:hypothetical protein
VRALTGRLLDAVELNATVVADPHSKQRFLGETTTIRENASATLAELKTEIDLDEYASAHASGTSTPYDIVAKKLITSLEVS